MITYSNEKKNLQHHYPYPDDVNMKVYIFTFHLGIQKNNNQRISFS